MGELTRAYGSHISVNLNTRRLSHFEGTRMVKMYPVGVGKPSTPTPAGNYQIAVKVLNPGGALGTRWMGLSIPTGNYGIHGTNNPQSIGGYVSNGCIRMFNRDVEELFPKVSIGTPVEILRRTTSRPGNISTNPSAGGRIHTVQAGDTLWHISAKYGKSIASIIELNKIKNPDLIYPGQVIYIPA